MIFVIDDDEIMRECVKKACNGYEVKEFQNALVAMEAISDETFPQMIFLDVMLTGPDGFTFLNELMTYDDTATIPIVIISGVDFGEKDLSAYGVVEVLNKDSFKPSDIKRLLEDYAK